MPKKPREKVKIGERLTKLKDDVKFGLLAVGIAYFVIETYFPNLFSSSSVPPAEKTEPQQAPIPMSASPRGKETDVPTVGPVPTEKNVTNIDPIDGLIAQMKASNPQAFVLKKEMSPVDRCRAIGKLLAEKKADLSVILIYLAQHSDQITDKNFQKLFTGTGMPYLAIDRRMAQAQNGINLHDQEIVMKRIDAAAWWIQGCNGSTAHKIFDNQERFARQYREYIVAALDGVAHALKQPSPEGEQVKASIQSVLSVIGR